jgi:hypothetical protein
MYQAVARKRRRLGDADWTPRERVRLLGLIADAADELPDAIFLLASLSQVVKNEECQPDAMAPDWRLPHA